MVYMDGTKLHLGNFGPLGGNGLIKIEDFPRAARDTHPASQFAIDHTVGHTGIHNKPELAQISNVALNYDQIISVQLEGNSAPALSRVRLRRGIGRPIPVREGNNG